MPRERQQQPQSIACQQCAAERQPQPIPGRNRPRTLEATNIAAHETWDFGPVPAGPAPSGFEPAE